MANAALEPLTSRESEVLAAVERRLTNAEIAAELQVSIRTVESHIAALRRKLGADSRSALVEAARWRRGTAVAVPQNSFVGRDADLTAVRRLLDRERWVTVVGPAGCGKTRLALELAAAGQRPPVVVELEHAHERDVVGVVARTLGVGSTPAGEVVDACAMALDAQSYLLVLDNADRVLDAVAGLVARLLVTARSLRVLVTSRAPLGGRDETVYQLAPLSPDNDAVTLFIDRARSAAGGTLPFDPNDEGVRRICRQLDGLPLALELAAARTRHLRLDEVLIVGDPPSAAAAAAADGDRHRSVDAALAWTWDLLDDQDRAVLSSLAALPWTFDLDLVESVAGSGTGPAVLRLLDRSLVAPVRTAAPVSTFRLLDAVRTFVRARTPAEVVDRVRRAHAAAVLSRAQRLCSNFDPADAVRAEQSAHLLRPDLIAAVDWAREHDPALALDLALGLTVLEDQYTPDTSALETLARVARDERVTDVADSVALNDLAAALFYGDLEVVEPLAGLALERAETDAQRLAAHHLAGLTDAYLYRGRAALDHLRLAERLATDLGDSAMRASVLQGIGLARRAADVNDFDGAFTAFEESLRAYASLGLVAEVNQVRYMMANTAATSGERTDQGVAWADECAAYARRTGNRHQLAHALLTRARLRPDDRPEDPREDLEAMADAFRAIGDLRCLARTYLVMADRRPAAEQIRLLETALDVGTRAHDPGHQEQALAGLLHRHWEAGDERRAAFELGRLEALVGEQAALDRCPPGLRERRDELATTIAEGLAYGAAPAPASAPASVPAR